MLETIRFICRLIATPVIAITFGFAGTMYLVLFIPALVALNFIHGESTDLRYELREAWDIFTEPLAKVWKSKP